MRRALVLVLACACSKSPREQAQAIVDDASLATPDALAKAGAIIYPKAKVWAEPRGDAWRVFVLVERDEKPSIENDGQVIKFYVVLDGKQAGQDLDMMGVGHKRRVSEVLVADRFHATLDGKAYTILQPRRTVARDDYSMQTFSEWDAADLAKAQPYDALMNERLPLR